MPTETLGLLLTGLLAGTIDAVAGGGGLITVPALVLVLGHGIFAVATNKMAGLSAALCAFLVYLSKGHFDWKRSVSFAFWVAFGSLAGSRVADWFPRSVFVWLLWGSSPVLLWLVWKKDLWIEK